MLNVRRINRSHANLGIPLDILENFVLFINQHNDAMFVDLRDTDIAISLMHGSFNNCYPLINPKNLPPT